MAGEWDAIQPVPVKLPDGTVADIKLAVPFGFIDNAGETIPNDGPRDLMTVSFRVHGAAAEFFRLCQLNAARMHETDYRIDKLDRIKSN